MEVDQLSQLTSEVILGDKAVVDELVALLVNLDDTDTQQITHIVEARFLFIYF